MRTGSCCCGAVRIEARGDPVKVGLCHCTTCRKQSGSAVTANPIWRAEDVTIHGETRSWTDTTVSRHFCPTCGSSLCGTSNGEIAIGFRRVRSGANQPGADLRAVGGPQGEVAQGGVSNRGVPRAPDGDGVAMDSSATNSGAAIRV
jgi:hypothetical protein